MAGFLGVPAGITDCPWTSVARSKRSQRCVWLPWHAVYNHAVARRQSACPVKLNFQCPQACWGISSVKLRLTLWMSWPHSMSLPGSSSSWPPLAVPPGPSSCPPQTGLWRSAGRLAPATHSDAPACSDSTPCCTCLPRPLAPAKVCRRCALVTLAPKGSEPEMYRSYWSDMDLPMCQIQLHSLSA